MADEKAIKFYCPETGFSTASLYVGMMFWKTFFWIAAALDLASTGAWILSPKNYRWLVMDVVALVFGIMAMVSVFGFAYKRQVGWRWLAIFTFSGNLMILVYVLIDQNHRIEAIRPDILLMFSPLFFGVIFLYFYPMFMYAFKSDNIWENWHKSRCTGRSFHELSSRHLFP